MEAAELLERRARHARTEERIRNLIELISRGETFSSIGDALADHEAQTKHERQAIAHLEETIKQPVRLPTPDLVQQTWARFERILEHDALRGREHLRLLFAGGLGVQPYPDGRYMAEGQFDATALLRLDLSMEGDKTTKAPKGLRGRTDVSSSSGGCAGPIGALNTGVSLVFERRITA